MQALAGGLWNKAAVCALRFRACPSPCLPRVHRVQRPLPSLGSSAEGSLRASAYCAGSGTPPAQSGSRPQSVRASSACRNSVGGAWPTCSQHWLPGGTYHQQDGCSGARARGVCVCVSHIGRGLHVVILCILVKVVPHGCLVQVQQQVVHVHHDGLSRGARPHRGLRITCAAWKVQEQVAHACHVSKDMSSTRAARRNFCKAWH